MTLPICSACICDHRERLPRPKCEKNEGHWRHAFFKIDDAGNEIWVCRSCFKRLRAVGEWEIMRSGEQQQVAGKLANAQRAEEEKQAALRTGEFFKNSANRAETDRPRAVLKQPGGKPPIVFYEW